MSPCHFQMLGLGTRVRVPNFMSLFSLGHFIIICERPKQSPLNSIKIKAYLRWVQQYKRQSVRLSVWPFVRPTAIWKWMKNPILDPFENQHVRQATLNTTQGQCTFSANNVDTLVKVYTSCAKDIETLRETTHILQKHVDTTAPSGEGLKILFGSQTAAIGQSKVV